jgi:3-methylcrotonyl-CoA carboxylase alpha subunit
MTRKYACGDEQHELNLRRAADGSASIRLDGAEHKVEQIERSGSRLSFVFQGQRHTADVLPTPGGFELWLAGQRFVFSAIEPGADTSGSVAGSGAGDLVSKMPGKVLALLVEPGAQVHKGQPLLILEAMKMEHEMLAPSAGTVIAFRKAAGDRVMPGDLLVDFE